MNCKVCSSDIKPKLILENSKNENSIYRCPKCKITFVNPQPSSMVLNDYYNGMYQNLTVSFNKMQMNRALYSMQGYLDRLKWNKAQCKDKSFLDLGGGLGYYAKAAKERGLSPILVEMDPVSVEFAKNELKLETIIQKDLNDFFDSANDKYDLVFFRHVIEHVTEPIDIIDNISNILKPGGVLIIETDNNAGIEILFQEDVKKFYLNLYNKGFKNVSFIKLLTKRPFALDPPRHLFGFRMHNLSNLLQSKNLKPFIQDHYRLGHPIYWPNIPSPKLKDIFKAFFKFKIKKGLIGLKDYFNLLFRIALQFLGLSSGLCIYARKSE